MNPSSKPDIARRRLLLASGNALVSVPLLSLLGCRGLGDTNPVATEAGSGSGWANGGTARIGDTARFPNPFTHDPGQACVLTCMTTIGPCHTLSPEREDISDGWDGIPLRLALRVVDADCRPVPDAIVEIWHTNHTGGYSGQIVRMCNNNADDLDKQFFRGYRRTDAEGIVRFNTCYPGWYSSRAVHIHLRVMTGSYDADDRATSSVTTQLLFSDELNREIFSSQALYKDIGLPDTDLDSDNVVGGETDKSPYLFDVQRMDDGVMFASKTLVIRNSLEDAICEAKGAHGFGPPPGGPPPRGFGPRPEGAGFGPPPGDPSQP